MHKRTLATLIVAAGLAVPATASAADRTITIDDSGATKTWTGTSSPGFNASFFDAKLPNTCSKDPQYYCDDTLVHFTSDVPYDISDLKLRIEGFAHSDFDTRLYESDAGGAVGSYITNGTGDGTGPLTKALGPTWMGDPETITTTAGPNSWFLLRVVYFTVPGDETYTGKVSWSGGFAEPEEEE